jgi:hypothetical protein
MLFEAHCSMGKSGSSSGGGSGGGVVNVLTNLLSSVVALIGSIIAFIFGIFGAIASLLSALPWLLIALAVTALMIPWISYQDTIIEETEHLLRGVIYPFYVSTLRVILNFIRNIYNPLICWFDAVNYWASGVVTQVIYPTVVDCADIGGVAVAAENFVLAVLDDFVVGYFFSQGYYAGPCDFTHICSTFQALWAQWVSIYTCACSDFGLLLYDLPIIPSLFWSAQWADPATCCAISNAVNAAMNVFAILLRLIEQVLQALLAFIAPQSPFAQVHFTRPNFYGAATLLCDAIQCAATSFENAINLFWNNYIPIYFDWTGMLGWLSSALCIGVKTINWMATLLINIDQVLLYPTNPFWYTAMKPLTLEILNLVAAPSQWDPVPSPAPPAPLRFTMTNYYWDTNHSATPNLPPQPNPVYNKTRLTTAVCTLIQRIICDASGESNSSSCFAAQAGNLLQGFDFCCFTDALGTTLVDVTSAAVELTYHVAVNGGSDFFIFIDRQPFTQALVDDVVRLASCVIALVKLIPDVGPALYNAVVELTVYVLDTLNYLLRVVLGVAELPYFVIQLPGTPEFITETNVALDAFVAIQQRLVANTSTSFMNSLCILLNSGFPIPPLPCSNCVTGGYIPLSRRRGHQGEPSRLHELSLYQRRPLLVTPLLFFNTTDRINFAEYAQTLWSGPSGPSGQPMSLPWNTRAAVASFMRNKKAEVLDNWRRVLTCKELLAEAAELRVTQPKIYRYRKQQGRYDCNETSLGSLSSATIPPHAWSERSFAIVGDEHNLDDRQICSPTPTCFDLCCTFRALLQTWVQLLSFAARFFNGFVQYQASQQGTVHDFPYFTGEFCQLGQPCFESDLTDLVMLAFEIPTCLCDFLNLVIPVSLDPNNARTNLCCAITEFADLLISLITIIINAINSLAQAQYTYFTTNLFLDDINMLFEIAANCVTCICTFTQYIFPLNYIPGIKAAINFDPCCGPAALLTFALDGLHTALNIIISLATITVNPESYCYFRLDRDAQHTCSGNLSGIGLVVDVFNTVDALFPVSDVGQGGDSCLLTCGQDQGNGGIVPCICQLFNTLIPWRTYPDLPVSCNISSPNCQKIDLCCPFVKLGIATNLSVKFLIQMLASLWQPWPNGLPEFFINYIFCDEIVPDVVNCGEIGPAASACSFAINNNVAPNGIGIYTCGELLPIISVLTDPINGLLADCLCQLFSLLDSLMCTFFTLMGSNWPNCFCSPVDGTLRSASNILDVLLTSMVQFVRLFPLPCYWKPSGISETFIGQTSTTCIVGVTPGCYCKWVQQPLTDPSESWIFQTLGPLANALCVAVGNIMCFVNSIFFVTSGCVPIGSKFLGSSVRWGFELIFRIGSFVEGFVRQFTDPDPTCVGGNPFCNVQNTVGFDNVQPAPLAQLLTSLLSWPIDTLIGDSDVSCSRICPHGTFYDHNLPSFGCGCYSLSPVTDARNASGGSVWELVVTGYDSNIGGPAYACFYASQAVSGNIQGANNIPGRYFNNQPCKGLGCFVPICAGIEDFVQGQYRPYDVQNFFQYGWPGTCANFSICRPDSLPSCATTSQITPNSTYTNYQGPIDGIFMGLIRYMACAIGSSGNIIFKPLITIISFIWQLLGGFIQLMVAWFLFLLSLFNLTGGCGCYDYSDPLQGGGIVKYSQGSDIDIGFCYPCPDANGQCGSPKQGILRCEAHCPCHATAPYNANVSAAQAWCVTTLTNYSNAKNWPSSPYACFLRFGVSGQAANAANLCNGFFGDQEWTPFCTAHYHDAAGIAQCKNYCAVNYATSAYAQVNCHVGFCQLGDICEIPVPGYTSSQVEGFNIGSTEPGNPNVLCSAITLVSDVVTLVEVFISILETPLITPNQKRDAVLQRPDNPVREYVTDFWHHTGITREVPGANEVVEKRTNKDPNLPDALVTDFWRHINITREVPRANEVFEKRTNKDPNLPSALELFAYAMWNYDTSDCFNDTVACVCRNFYIPQYCGWNAHVGVIPTLTRARRSANQSADTISKEEIISIVSERFVHNTSCDFLAHSLEDAVGTGQPIDDISMAAWVTCVDKRIQGERVELFTQQVVPAHIFYHTQAPLELMRNLANGLQKRVERSVENRVIHRRNSNHTTALEREFPDLADRLRKRREAGERYLMNKRGLAPCDPAFSITLDADAMYHKYETGYYGAMARNFGRAWQSGRWFWPDLEDSKARLRLAIHNMKATVWEQPYARLGGELWEAADAGARLARDVLFETGVVQSVRDSWTAVETHFAARAASAQCIPSVNVKRWQAMPIVAWWKHLRPEPYTERNTTRRHKGFLHHLRSAISYRRQQVAASEADVEGGFWALDLSVANVASRFVTRWTQPVWTQRKLHNWKRVARVGFRIYDSIWPGSMSEGERERFLFDSNCPFAEKLLNLTVHLIDVCLAHQNNSNTTRSLRLGSYYGERNMRNYRYDPPSKDPNARLQLRHIGPPPSAAVEAAKERETQLKLVDERSRKRATFGNTNIQTGPGGLNFYAWFTNWFFGLFDFMFNTDSNSWIADVRAWIQNPNTDESYWPNVGLRYWLLFPIRCNFPENLDCSKGFGLETAMIWVTVGIIGVLLAGAFVFPPFSWPFMVVNAAIWWFFLVMALGLHYSPRCMFLAPSLTGIGVTLPFCLMDSIIALTDKYITNCYAPFIIPVCLISGDPCPADPATYIDFINCSVVGVSDGIQNVLFLLYQLFGQPFYDITISITSATIGNIIPGLNTYMLLTMNSFKDASGCQLERQWVCFGLTAPAIALPLLLFALVFVAFGFVIPLLIIVLIALWNFILNTPLYDDEAWADPPIEAEQNSPPSQPTQQQQQQQEEDPEIDGELTWLDYLRQKQQQQQQAVVDKK